MTEGTESWGRLACIIFLLVLIEVVLTSGYLSADNIWHFKWSQDITNGRLIFWSGSDANRIFPDLLFSIIAALLPGGGLLPVWARYYCIVSTLAIGGSLYLLGQALYNDARQPFAFVAVSTAAFATITALPFWNEWIMKPGNHGGSLSAVIAAQALLLMNINGERPRYALLLIYACLCAGLVMSNRYLLICTITPIVVSILTSSLSWERAALLAVITLSAAALGLFLLHELNHSSFYQLASPGHQPSVDNLFSLNWWEDRFPKEIRQLVSTWSIKQVGVGMLIMLAATFFSLRKSRVLPVRFRVFARIVATSVVCAFTFMLIMVDDSGDWRYRFFVVPVVVAVVFLSGETVRLLSCWSRLSVIVIALYLVQITAFCSKEYVQLEPEVEFSDDFNQEIGRLRQVLSRLEGNRIHRGFANYWIANEISARAADISLSSIDNDGAVLLYNNNATEICHEGFSFVVIWKKLQWPNLEAVTTLLGEPISTERVAIGRFGQVEILFYDQSTLDRKIRQPGWDSAKLRFPTIACSEGR